MKKFVPLALMALATTVCVAAQQSTQSSPALGDVARKQRAQDQAAPTHKVWTNDDFPGETAPAAQPAENVETPTEPAATDSQPKTEATADKEKSQDKTKGTAAEQEKLDAEWKGKIDAQKSKIADLKREFDLTDRENKLAATTYYADAGNRLRDQKDFTDKQTSYHEKLSTLQKQIADEQTKLSDLQDEAHKAGANKAYE